MNPEDNVINLNFPKAMIDRIEDFGRAQERLKLVLGHELFDNLSKHNPYWESEHDVESEKLYDVRCKLGCILDNLWDVWAVLKRDEE